MLCERKMVLRSLAVSITCHRKCKIRLLFENESKYKQTQSNVNSTINPIIGTKKRINIK